MLADFNFIVSRLETGHWDDRVKACRVLASSDDPRAWEPLAKALGDHELAVREAASVALTQMRDARSVDPLIALLERETHLPLRCQIIDSLATHRDIRAAPAIAKLLNDDEVEVRLAACNALGLLNAVKATKLLIQRLADTSYYVRAVACQSLGRLRQTSTIRPLIERLGDLEPNVRKNALDALQQLGEQYFVQAYANAFLSPGLDTQYFEKLASLGDVRIVSALLLRLEDQWIDEAPKARIVDVLQAIYPPSLKSINSLYCTKHLARFEKKKIDTPGEWEDIRYVGCRECGSTLHVIAAPSVRAVVDDRMKRPMRFDNGTLRIKWKPDQPMFDFDDVELGETDEKTIAALCIAIGNDTEQIRRSHYTSAKCYVKAAKQLSSNTRGILQRTFTEIVR